MQRHAACLAVDKHGRRLVVCDYTGAACEAAAGAHGRLLGDASTPFISSSIAYGGDLATTPGFGGWRGRGSAPRLGCFTQKDESYPSATFYGRRKATDATELLLSLIHI